MRGQVLSDDFEYNCCNSIVFIFHFYVCIDEPLK